MSLIIRPATVADAPDMSRVLISSITQLCTADHSDDAEAIAAWTRNKSPLGLVEMLSNAELSMLVAERDGSVVGVGAFNRDGQIQLNYISPSTRGSGVSTALLAHMEAELVTLGYAIATLEATATALAFYERRGWHVNGPQATGRRVNGYPMSKTLSS